MCYLSTQKNATDIKCARALFTKYEVNTYHITLLGSMYLFSVESWGWSCEAILCILSIELVFWQRLTWSPLNFTAESLQVTQPLTQMSVLFLLFLSANVAMGTRSVCLLNEVSKPILCSQRRHLKCKGRWEQCLPVYSCISSISI